MRRVQLADQIPVSYPTWHLLSLAAGQLGVGCLWYVIARPILGQAPGTMSPQMSRKSTHLSEHPTSDVDLGIYGFHGGKCALMSVQMVSQNGPKTQVYSPRTKTCSLPCTSGPPRASFSPPGMYIGGRVATLCECRASSSCCCNCCCEGSAEARPNRRTSVDTRVDRISLDWGEGNRHNSVVVLSIAGSSVLKVV